MFSGYSTAHVANILLHLAGSLVASAAGFIALFAVKGGGLHVRSGRAFQYSYLVVLCTAVGSTRLTRSHEPTSRHAMMEQDAAPGL